MNGVVSAGNKKDARNGNASVSGSQKDLRNMSGSQKDFRNETLSASSSQRDLQNGGGSVNGSQRDLRINSGDGNDEKYRGKFTGKSTLKNPFGSSTTLSSTAPTENSGDDLDDHINVVLRVRPANGQERERKDQFVTKFHGEGRVEVDHVSVNRSFVYNVVFEPEASQEDVFDHSGVKKLIDMSINGYACTAFAFGQTGSGKTHTMTGPPQQFEGGKQPETDMQGVIQRSFRYLVQQLGQVSGNKTIKASYLEIYNEQVIDLLNTNHRRYLNVRWSKNKGFYVENLFIVECETVDDLMAVLEEGMRNRQTGSHGLNEFSSRSHSMLTLTVDTEQVDPDDENLYLTKRGKLTFVDLAGSEKVKDSGSSAEMLIESNNINRSLLVLGNCISSLGDPKKRQGHIPYRDSKLTKLLADSLGGNGVTLMIACVTPSAYHVHETTNTLRYASRAKRIKSKPVIKMDPREKLILSLKREIKILRNENHYLREQLEFPAKPKGDLQKNNDEKFMKMVKDMQSKASPGDKDLYAMLQEYMIENEALRNENSELHRNKDQLHRDHQSLSKHNERLQVDIEKLQRSDKGRHNNGEPYRSPQNSSKPPYNPPPQRLPPNPNQGYVSPTAGRGKPPPSHGQPKRPPHRLSEPLMRPAQLPPEHLQNGYVEEGYMSPRGRPPIQNGGMRQDSLTHVNLPAIPTVDQTYVLIHSRRQYLHRLKREKYNSIGDLRAATSFSSFSYLCELEWCMCIVRFGLFRQIF
ncbi:kinesin-like protein KIF12 isoform X5 [Mytilus californianus]|uniref:kinesin-like protein KIF12 isoform X5 n=1 Tax=Mytilus californianus TaxID=6549 RepID=UPI0022476717|nr:kinesin-like protein KIF12 isoform X5 [Mytilus californianus]